MVGCSLFTQPAPCVQLDRENWMFPRFPPFNLGPFSPPPSSLQKASAWAPTIFLDPHPGYALATTIDVGLYSLVLIVSDLLLSLTWHYLISKFFNRPEFRLPFLSPSMRFTLGVLFGALRNWTLSYIQPLLLYQYMSQASFLVGMVLGLTALVFHDGPWRNVRSNPTHALNPDSMLNPVHLTKVTKQTLARASIRRSLESGKTISIVLDGEANLLFCQRGALQLRHASLFRRASKHNAIIQLMAREEECISGKRFFFGFWRGAPFSHFGVIKLNDKHKRFLLDLMLHLNHLTEGEVRWFQIPNAVAEQLNEECEAML